MTEALWSELAVVLVLFVAGVIGYFTLTGLAKKYPPQDGGNDVDS